MANNKFNMNMQLGNLPIFILPTTKLVAGDLIKDAGEYYFVMNVAASNNNPVMSYLMLDMFMGKKKEEKAKQPAQNPPRNPAR